MSIRGLVTCPKCGGTKHSGPRPLNPHEHACADLSPCQHCHGRGVVPERGFDVTAPPEGPIGSIEKFVASLEGFALFVLYVIVGIGIVLFVAIPIAWWSEIADGLRSLLEALPLGEAVADSAAEEGRPVLVGLSSLGIVGLAVAAMTHWRRRQVVSYLNGELTFAQIYMTSVLRTLVIFGGLSLVPNLVAVAHGTDLRRDPENSFTGAIFVVAILVGWAVYSYAGLRRLVDDQIARPRP